MVFNVTVPPESSKYDLVKWLLILLLLIIAIVANIYFQQVPSAIRLAIGIVLFAVILGIASQTLKGNQAWLFIKSARLELRKVVWPSRQETVQTTLLVVAMVVVMAIILWGLDGFFMWAVSWMTGQRGV